MTDVPGRLTAALADRYQLERELGQGGMATVYLAEDLKHDRKVAVKVLRPELAAVIGADRFLSEIKTTANLQHPHILPLFDSGEADGFLFYVMPFVEGETVRDRMTREKQLPVADAVRITTEVAAALDYAHRHNVIHRDIKPENILLHDGSALVADFGIALAASKAGGSRMTETGMSLGTPHYMSPEQAMGEREITARSDVYALGCVLYEMLTGDPPFTGSTAQAIVARVVTESPRPMLPAAGDDPGARRGGGHDLAAEAPGRPLQDGRGIRRGAGRLAIRLGVDRRDARGERPAQPGRGPDARGWWPAWRWWRASSSARGCSLAPRQSVRSGSRSPSPPSCRRSRIRLSPDGGTLAYVSGQGDRLSIYTRRLDDLRPRRLEGTDDAIHHQLFSRRPVDRVPRHQQLAAQGTDRRRDLRRHSRSKELPGSPPSSLTGPTGSSSPPRAPLPPSPPTGR